MPSAYFGSVTIGTGTDEDPRRPQIGDETGLAGWACAYEEPLEQEAVVRVYSNQATLDTLATKYELLYTGPQVGVE